MPDARDQTTHTITTCIITAIMNELTRDIAYIFHEEAKVFKVHMGHRCRYQVHISLKLLAY